MWVINMAWVPLGVCIIAEASATLGCSDPFKFGYMGQRPTCIYVPSLIARSQTAAKENCEKFNGYLLRPQSLSELESVVEQLRVAWPAWLGKSGFWVGYERNQTAAEGSQDYQNIRRNKDLFFGGETAMPHEMWRESQPGDLSDFRDEMCVARKKINDVTIQGVDDYRCEGGLGHATFCEQSPVANPS